MTVVPTPPGWYTDPVGVHELRYFDGQTWTEHVSVGGRVGRAPLTTGAPGAAAWTEHAATGGLRPGAWLPQIPRFKMWALTILSAFLFWVNVDGHRIVLPIGIPCALWCWHTTADVFAAHDKAGSPAVSEIRVARYIALAFATFCFLQFVIWTY